MKKFPLILFFALLATTISYGQTVGEDGGIVIEPERGGNVMIRPDNSTPSGFTISLAGYEVAFTGTEDYQQLPPNEKFKWNYRRHYRGHLSYIDFGFSGLHSVNYRGHENAEHPNFLDLRNGKSIYFAFNVFKTSTPLDKRGRFGFTTGLSVVWRNYTFDNRITLVKENGSMVPQEINTDRFKKSKLTTVALDIPILFEANFGRRFFVSAGGYAGIVLGSHTKFKSPKTKSRGGNGIELLEYGLTARAGFRHIYAFGNYGLNNLFKSGVAPKAKTYTVGFSFPF